MLPSPHVASGGTLSLILLPGTLTDQRVFGPLLDRLARSGASTLHVLVLETHHASNIVAAAEQVLAASPERFALLGFSLGGIIALQVALLAKHRILGLALLNSTAAAVPAGQHIVRSAQVSWARKHGAAAFLRERLWPLYVCRSSLENESLRFLLTSMADSLGAEVFSAQTELAVTRPDLRTSLPSLTMPTLILGGIDDQINSFDVQQALASALPQATLAMIENAGHFALLERPDAVAEHVMVWLASLANAR